MASNNTTTAAFPSSGDPEIDAYRLQHAGHERQHSLMMLIILGFLLGFQVLSLWWQRKHQRSYQAVTLAGMWFFPLFLVLSSKHGWQEYTRFLTIWTLFTLGNLWIGHQATRKPIDHQTPGLGLTGALMIFFQFFGLLNLLGLSKETSIAYFQTAFYLLVYGLYFGVLGRDLVTVLADTMASTIGYYSKDGLPKKHLRSNICAICGDQVLTTDILPYESIQNTQSRASRDIFDTDMLVADDPTIQFPAPQPSVPDITAQAIRLDCRHSFHTDCIRGWCLIGKKDMCPYCKEKVDLKKFQGSNPWETQQVAYLQILDAVRYLVVWQPFVLLMAQVVIHLLGLH